MAAQRRFTLTIRNVALLANSAHPHTLLHGFSNADTITSDYNCFANGNATVVQSYNDGSTTASRTLSQWQSLGKDTHSIAATSPAGLNATTYKPQAGSRSSTQAPTSARWRITRAPCSRCATTSGRLSLCRCSTRQTHSRNAGGFVWGSDHESLSPPIFQWLTLERLSIFGSAFWGGWIIACDSFSYSPGMRAAAALIAPSGMDPDFVFGLPLMASASLHAYGLARGHDSFRMLAPLLAGTVFLLTDIFQVFGNWKGYGIPVANPHHAILFQSLPSPDGRRVSASAEMKPMQPCLVAAADIPNWVSLAGSILSILGVAGLLGARQQRRWKVQDEEKMERLNAEASARTDRRDMAQSDNGLLMQFMREIQKLQEERARDNEASRQYLHKTRDDMNARILVLEDHSEQQQEKLNWLQVSYVQIWHYAKELQDYVARLRARLKHLDPSFDESEFAMPDLGPLALEKILVGRTDGGAVQINVTTAVPPQPKPKKN